MSALMVCEDTPTDVDDPRFPYTGCWAYVVVFDRRQWCQHGSTHVGLHC